MYLQFIPTNIGRGTYIRFDDLTNIMRISKYIGCIINNIYTGQHSSFENRVREVHRMNIVISNDKYYNIYFLYI